MSPFEILRGKGSGDVLLYFFPIGSSETFVGKDLPVLVDEFRDAAWVIRKGSPFFSVVFLLGVILCFTDPFRFFPGPEALQDAILEVKIGPLVVVRGRRLLTFFVVGL